ncbi:MAG TPA: hypothetical protein VN803_11590 [Gemmatimonadales bacterium]|nr:hypothetical protein [Gemmatimonadales bacterium]
MPLEFPVFEPFELKREKPPGFTLEVPSDFNPGEFKLDLPDPLPDGELEFEPLGLPGFQSLAKQRRGREAANLSRRRQGGRQGRAQRRKITRPEI